MIDDDQLIVLYSKVIPKTDDTVKESDTEEGIRLRVQREEQAGTMKTTNIGEIS